MLDISSHIVHVLCACGSNATKRFRNGILHLISKALPQRSIIKHCDRASVEFARTQQETHAFLQRCAPGLCIEKNFTQVLLALRKLIAQNLIQNPALFNFTNNFFCAKTLCTELKLIKKNTIWTLQNFLHNLRTMLPKPPKAAVHALHVAFSMQPQNVQLEDVLEKELCACRMVKRRLRKAALRKKISELEPIALSVRVAAFLRYKRHFTTNMPFGPKQPRIFYACSNCNSHRSTEGGFGANRVLFCNLSNMLTCGKKYDSHCQHTALAQVKITKNVVHIIDVGSFAQCAKCHCTFRYSSAKTWQKGVMCCSQCYHCLTACVDKPCCPNAPAPEISGTSIVRKRCRECKARAQNSNVPCAASGAI